MFCGVDDGCNISIKSRALHFTTNVTCVQSKGLIIIQRGTFINHLSMPDFKNRANTVCTH